MLTTRIFVTYLRKYYSDTDALARSTWDQPLEPTLEKRFYKQHDLVNH